MTSILFGSISTIADTSELQRDAFNRAFREHGLDWEWGRDDYRELLRESGGRDRVAAQAKERGEDVDADAVHATKSRIFQESLPGAGLHPRDGVVETIREAKEAGHRVALVTTTATENVDALLSALEPGLGRTDFALVADASDVDRPKPDGAAYRAALEALGEDAAGAVAIEDNLGGVQAAKDAGVAVVAFPNANTADHDFAPADGRVDGALSLSELQSIAGRG